MSKLNKSLEDYFQLPILLKPVGDTSQRTLKRFESILNSSFQEFELEQHECQQLEEAMKDVIKSRGGIRHTRLRFLAQDFNTDWPQFEAIYKCHIVIAIYDGKENDPTKLKDNFSRLNKQIMDERRKLVSLFVINLEKEKQYELEVDRHFMFLPDVGDQDLATFLEPALHQLVKESFIYLVDQIRKLRNQENDYIVFNKNEERPEFKTIKKKKRGRCLKLAGDYCLTLMAEEEALAFYKQAMALLKSSDDYHWMMGVEQGRAAASLLKHLQMPKITGQPLQLVDYILSLNELMGNAIQLARKAKMTVFQSQCFFKVMNAHKDINNGPGVDQWASQFINQSLKNYVLDEQVIYLSEISLIFESLKMIRKRNYYLCNAALMYSEKKPEVSRMFLNHIRNTTPKLHEWKQLNMLLLKELARCDANDSFRGFIQCTLLSNCTSKLTLNQIGELVQKLNLNLLEPIKAEINMLTLDQMIIEESLRKPKENRIGKPQKDHGVTAPWRRLIDYKFQAHEKIKFIAVLGNPLPVALNIKYRLVSQPANDSKFRSIYLQPSRSTTHQITSSFTNKQQYKVYGLEVSVWNFIFIMQLPKQIRLEIYDQTSDYQIQTPSQFLIEKSSLLRIQFALRNVNSVKSSKLKLNVSVYYMVETGLQENIYLFHSHELQEESMIVECRESNLKACESKMVGNRLVMQLQQLRVHRSLLKKVEINIEYIHSDTAKYQISAMSVVPVTFKQSIHCQITKFTEVDQQLSKLFDPSKLVIHPKYTAFVRVSKHPEDLKAYHVTLFFKGEKIDDFILSEKVEMIKTLILPKEKFEEKDIESLLSTLIEIKWSCITDPELKGLFYAGVAPNIKYSVMKLSEKTVHAKFYVNNQKIVDGEVQVRHGQILTIKYQIQGQGDCGHQVTLHSKGVKERHLGYAIQGKTKFISKEPIRNKIEVQFENNYSTCFIFALHFANQVYFCDRLLNCIE